MPSTATYAEYPNGYLVYPSVSLEVKAPSQDSFTNANPYFVTLFQLYLNGKPYQAPWNGQNLISASSSSSSDDYGSMVGLNATPSVVAWGAQEHFAKSTYQFDGRLEYITYYYNVSWWMLGTQDGINAYATQNGLPVNNEMYTSPFVSLVTSPQQDIAVPSSTITVYY